MPFCDCISSDRVRNILGDISAALLQSREDCMQLILALKKVIQELEKKEKVLQQRDRLLVMEHQKNAELQLQLTKARSDLAQKEDELREERTTGLRLHAKLSQYTNFLDAGMMWLLKCSDYFCRNRTKIILSKEKKDSSFRRRYKYPPICCCFLLIHKCSTTA